MTELHVICSSKERRTFNLDKDAVTLGRSSDNDVTIEDTLVSRKHLIILRNRDKYYIRDLKSSNGTYIHGKQIHSGDEFEVEQGVPIVVGKTIISIGRAFEGDVSETFDTLHSSKKAEKIPEGQENNRFMTLENNMRFICKLSQALSEPHPINDILETILNLIFDLLKRIDRGVIILVDTETGKTQDVISRIKRNSDDTIMMYSRTVVNQVVEEGKAIMIANAFEGENVTLSESLRLLRIGSVMCVPLISKSKVWGALYMDSIARPHGFREEDLDLMKAVSVQAALAIENAWLHSKHQK